MENKASKPKRPKISHETFFPPLQILKNKKEKNLTLWIHVIVCGLHTTIFLHLPILTMGYNFYYYGIFFHSSPSWCRKRKSLALGNKFSVILPFPFPLYFQKPGMKQVIDFLCSSISASDHLCWERGKGEKGTEQSRSSRVILMSFH